LLQSTNISFTFSKYCTGYYGYAFNGQEKDQEIYNNQSTTTATFWEYDGRIGRRWNLDPKPQINMSDYSCFGNNPIFMVDPLGDVVGDYFSKQGEWIKNDGIDDGKIYIDNKDINSIKTGFSDQAIKGISNYFYEKAGGKLSELVNNSITIGVEGFASTATGKQWGYPANKSSIKINKNVIGIYIKSSYDLINTFVHERDHRNKHIRNINRNPSFKYIEDRDFWDFEGSATNLQTNHSSWYKTSKEFKQYIYSAYGKYEAIFSYKKQECLFGKFGIRINYWDGSYKKYENEDAFMKEKPLPHKVPSDVYKKPND